MAKVNLNDLVAERIDPATVGGTPTFKAVETKAADDTHRAWFEGALDEAGSFRVRVYKAADFSKPALTVTPGDLRKDRRAPKGVLRSRDGRVNQAFFEKDGNLVMLWVPVAYDTFESITIELAG